MLNVQLFTLHLGNGIKPEWQHEYSIYQYMWLLAHLTHMILLQGMKDRKKTLGTVFPNYAIFQSQDYN